MCGVKAGGGCHLAGGLGGMGISVDKYGWLGGRQFGRQKGSEMKEEFVFEVSGDLRGLIGDCAQWLSVTLATNLSLFQAVSVRAEGKTTWRSMQ